MKALILSADKFEDSELLVPYYRFQEAGLQVDVAAPAQGKITGLHGYQVDAGKSFAEANPDDYGLLFLPGGRAPQTVRHEAAAQNIARAFFAQNKPVAAICHGPQTLISAGLLQGRRATCYRSVAEEMKAAGALYEDSEAVVDGNLVTARHPPDLPAFLREVMKMLGESKQA